MSKMPANSDAGAATRNRISRLSGQRRFLTVLNRSIAAIAGCYVVTALVTACLARLLPMARVESTIAATLFSFALFAVLVLAVFSARSGIKVWFWLIGAAAISGAILSLSIVMGGRA